MLFATVFSIGALTRHAEITAAKASGISFYRLIMPIFLGAILACGLDLGLSEVVPITNRRRSQLLQEDKAQVGTNRYNFTFGGEYGRVYKATELRTDSGRISGLQIERKGSGPKYPTYLLMAETARYSRRPGEDAVDPVQGRPQHHQRHRAVVQHLVRVGAGPPLHGATDRHDVEVARSP